MTRALRAFVIWLLLVSALTHPGHASERTDTHLGQINAVCADADNCMKLKRAFRDIDNCTKMLSNCKAASDIQEMLFSPTAQKKFADYFLYFEQTAPGVFTIHQGALLWKGRNTPYLFGVQEVYVIILTEYKTCFDAHGTTLAKNEPNPFEAVLKVLGKSLAPAENQSGLKGHDAKLIWYPLSGEFERPVMWLAIGSISVEMNTADWITVRLVLPKEQARSTQSDKSSDNSNLLPDECVYDPAAMPRDGRALTYSGDVLARNAFFSNNRESRVGLAVAFGLTFTSLKFGPGTATSPNPDIYALAKVYPFINYMPRLRSDPRAAGSVKPKRTIGIFAGTKFDAKFNEFLLGISLGHLSGNVGVVVGINHFVPTAPPNAPATTNTSRRQTRPFGGIEYAF